MVVIRHLECDFKRPQKSDKKIQQLNKVTFNDTGKSDKFLVTKTTSIIDEVVTTNE